MAQRFYNNFSTTLSAAATASSASLSLSVTPEMTNDDWCWLTLQANISGATVIEIVKAIKAADNFVFERGQQSTLPSDFPAGSKVENRATAADFSRSTLPPEPSGFSPVLVILE